jgi:trimeric autotransporter adhesin
LYSSEFSSFEVLFDGRAAPVLYTSPNQVNVIVPFEVAGQTMTMIQLINIPSAIAGNISNTEGESDQWAVRVAPSAPGIFTLNQKGQGAAAVLNQDNSVNGPTNPALRGTAIQIFATGGGQTSPPSTTGAITQSASQILALPATVSIGGVNAQVTYSGGAPEEISDVVQINAVVPQTVTPGPAVPRSITVGSAASPVGTTIAVQ